MRALVVGLLAALLAPIAGCTVNNPYVVEINGRRVSFEELQHGSIPEGVQVLNFHPGGMRVIGDVPIDVNGLHCVSGSPLSSRCRTRIS